MGIGSSKIQTSYSGSPGEGRVGKFILSPDLQKETQVLSSLFDKLLTKNNLLNFAELLKQRGACGELQVILASQINKEFQTLRFPDPSNPSTLQTSSFIGKEQYEAISKDNEILKVVCGRISEFLIRFVILISALTFSISLPSGLPEISDSSAQDIYRPSKPPISDRPVPGTIWELFSSKIRKISDDLLSMNNEYFMNRGGYVYANKPKSAVLNMEFQYWHWIGQTSRSKGGSGFYSISPEDAQREEDELIRQWMRSQGYPETMTIAEGRQKKAIADQTFRPSATGIPGTYGGKRGKTRSRRARSARKRGGQTTALEGPGSPVGVSPLVSSTPANTPAIAIPATPLPPKKKFFLLILRVGGSSAEYVFDEELNTYNKSAFMSMSDGDRERLTATVSEGRRQDLLWVLDSVFIPLVGKDVEIEMIRQRFSTAEKFDLLMLDSYTKAKGKEREFYSPAAYRAFLLASSIPIFNPNAIESYFCRDTWALTSFISKPAFATLEGLYEYDPGKGVEGDENATYKKQEFINNLLSGKYASQKTSDRTTKIGSSFESLEFPDNKDPKERAKIAGICSSSRSTGVLVENKESIAILMNGYNQLKQLYQQHVKQVYSFLKTIIVVDGAFEQLILLPSLASTKPVIRLNETFVKYSTGSHMALNERIQFARDMLANHYLQVEKIYNDTLNQYNNAI